MKFSTKLSREEMVTWYRRATKFMNSQLFAGNLDKAAELEERRNNRVLIWKRMNPDQVRPEFKRSATKKLKASVNAPKERKVKKQRPTKDQLLAQLKKLGLVVAKASQLKAGEKPIAVFNCTKSNKGNFSTVYASVKMVKDQALQVPGLGKIALDCFAPVVGSKYAK